MILTLELPPALADKIAAIPESDRNQYVISALALGLHTLAKEATEEKAWWDSLTPEEQEASRAAVARSLAAADAGRVHPAEEVYARIRAKYAHLADKAQGEQSQ